MLSVQRIDSADVGRLVIIKLKKITVRDTKQKIKI